MGRRDVPAQLLQPGVPALVGGAAGRQAQRIGLGVAQRAQLGPETGAQNGVGDEDIGDLQPRQVEGFRRRGASDRAGGDVPAQRGEGRGASAGQGQVGVDLVGDHHDAVPARHLRQLGQLLAAPHPAHRVVRVAQEQQAGAGARQRLLQGGGVAAVDAVGVPGQRHRDDGAAIVLDDLAEGVVDGLLDDDGVARPGQGPHRQGQGGDHPGGDDVPVGVDGPAVAAGEPAGQGGVVGGVGLGVAEDAVAHPPQQGGGDRGRRAVVHVRHPQGQGGGGAAALGGEVPFEAGGAGAVVDEIELGEGGGRGCVEWNGVAERERGGGTDGVDAGGGGRDGGGWGGSGGGHGWWSSGRRPELRPARSRRAGRGRGASGRRRGADWGLNAAPPEAVARSRAGGDPRL